MSTSRPGAAWPFLASATPGFKTTLVQPVSLASKRLYASGAWSSGSSYDTKNEGLALPVSMSFNDYWIPVIRASLELTRNHSERAIELLQRSAPYEMASPVTWSELGGPYYPAYLRGATDFALHRGTEAAAEYQKILDHPGFMRACLLGAQARLGLARSYLVAGDTDKARAGYQDFLTLWKDADPDILILKEAKAEYAKLR